MIVERDTISSISRDLIPYLIRKQFAPPRRHQKDIYKYIPDLPREKASYLVPSVSHEDRIRCHALVLDEVHGLSRPNPKALYSCTRIKNLALYKDVNHGVGGIHLLCIKALLKKLQIYNHITSMFADLIKTPSSFCTYFFIPRLHTCLSFYRLF